MHGWKKKKKWTEWCSKSFKEVSEGIATSTEKKWQPFWDCVLIVYLRWPFSLPFEKNKRDNETAPIALGVWTNKRQCTANNMLLQTSLFFGGFKGILPTVTSGWDTGRRRTFVLIPENQYQLNQKLGAKKAYRYRRQEQEQPLQHCTNTTYTSLNFTHFGIQESSSYILRTFATIRLWFITTARFYLKKK